MSLPSSFLTPAPPRVLSRCANLLIINKLYVFSSKEDNYTIYIKENPYKSYIDFFLLDKNSHTVRETVNINRMPNSKNDHVNSIALMRLNNILSVRKTLKEMDESEDWYSEYWDSIQQKQEKPTESKLDRNKNLIMTQQVKNFIVKNAKTKMNADPNEVFLQRANIESILGNTYFNQVRVFFEGYLQKLDDTFDLIHSEFDEKINKIIDILKLDTICIFLRAFIRPDIHVLQDVPSLGSGCSPVVEHTPRDTEVVGLNPARC